MTIIEALSDPRFVSGEMWARPVCLRGKGKAYAKDPDGFGADGIPELVPRRSNPVPWKPRIGWILDSWELVTPDQVLGERG